MTLEQTENAAENVEPVSETEPVEQVSQPEGEVSTLTQEDVERAVTEKLTAAEAKMQSAKDKELQPLKDKIAEMEKAASQNKLGVLEANEIAEQGDTPDLRQFHTDRRKFYEDKQTNDLLVARAIQTNETTSAKEIAAEFGIDKDALMAGDSPDAMRLIAKSLAYDKLKEDKDEKPPQKVDSGVPSSDGVDLNKMYPHNPEGLISFGVAHQKKTK